MTELTVAASGATPDRLLKDLNSLGLLFESMVYKELSIYSRSCNANVYHYRDNTGFEVDAIVENRQADQTLAERCESMTWVQRLKRIFYIDIETCRECGGDVRIIASIA